MVGICLRTYTEEGEEDGIVGVPWCSSRALILIHGFIVLFYLLLESMERRIRGSDDAICDGSTTVRKVVRLYQAIVVLCCQVLDIIEATARGTGTQAWISQRVSCAWLCATDAEAGRRVGVSKGKEKLRRRLSLFKCKSRDMNSSEYESLKIHNGTSPKQPFQRKGDYRLKKTVEI